MSGAWLASGISAVDSGLQLYWGVRRMVCDGEGATKQDAEKKEQQGGVRWSQTPEYMTGYSSKEQCSSPQIGWQQSRTKQQSLPPIAEGQEMGGMGWSRQQDNRYRSIGGKTVNKVSYSTQKMWSSGSGK